LRVLVACEESQRVATAFREWGNKAYSCDLLACSGGHPEYHLQCDVREVLYEHWDMLIAHPVCRRLALSGVRWLHTPPKNRTLPQMWAELDEAAAFYRLFQEADIPKKCIENPLMHRHAKQRIHPGTRQVVQPHWFGEKTFKATGYELTGLPDLVPTNKLNPPKPGTEEHKKWSWVHRMAPGPEREKNRSKTPLGIAVAMADQWGAI